MGTPSHITLLEKLRAAGLTVTGAPECTSKPSVDSAWRSLSGFLVEPVETVPLDSPGSVIHSLWLRHAKNSVIGDDGSFLVTAVVTGSHEIGWVPVALTSSSDVSRLRDDQNRVEFIARSHNGDALCGVTAEEYVYWIVHLHVT
jgi:hypothetical protein